MKTFLIEDFYICHGVDEKFETALMVYSGTWGKLFHEKTRSRKSRGNVPLRKSMTIYKNKWQDYSSFRVFPKNEVYGGHLPCMLRHRAT
jgi:hypothetical protein